jgi:hypothetical protein
MAVIGRPAAPTLFEAFFAITYLVQGLIVRFPKLRKYADPN